MSECSHSKKVSRLTVAHLETDFNPSAYYIIRQPSFWELPSKNKVYFKIEYISSLFQLVAGDIRHT